MAPQWKCSTLEINGKTLYKIITPELVSILSDGVCKFWKNMTFDDKVRFPGAQPVSIELKDVPTLKKNKYVVCAKLDGERYFLYITKIPEIISKPTENLLNVSLLVNRNMEFFIITLSCPEIAYSGGCLLDGELVNSNFIVHDSIIVSGNIVGSKDWETRWKTTDKFISTDIKPSKDSTFGIFLKKFYHLGAIKTLFKDMEAQSVPTDGVVMYPIADSVKFKTQDNLFKWKPPGHHTVDFIINIVGASVDLITWGNGKEIVYHTLPRGVFETIGGVNNGDIVEFNTKFVGGVCQFIPFLKRNDKPKGNNLYTVKKTILNAKENITQENLIKLLS